MPKLQPCIHDALNFCGIEHVSCQIFAGAVNFTQLVLQQHCWSWIASYQCYKVGQQLLYTRCTDVQESYPLKMLVAGQIIQLSNMHVNDCQSSSQDFSWQVSSCQHIHLSLQWCQAGPITASYSAGLSGPRWRLPLPDSGQQVCYACKHGLVELLSCKMYAQRLQDNNPENKQNRQTACALTQDTCKTSSCRWVICRNEAVSFQHCMLPLSDT